MFWHCIVCGKHFLNGLEQVRRAPNGRVLFICPTCGSQRIEFIK